MFLLVDVGNTTITVGKYEKGVCSLEKVFPTSLIIDSLPSDFLKLIENSELIAVSSVVPEVDVRLKEFDPNKFFFIGCDEVEKFMEIDYATMDTLGIDRVINVFATSILYGSPAIVVDVGSAVTVDVLDEGGSFQGGVIFPGPFFSIDALSRNTGKLFRVEVKENMEFKVGKSSRECLEVGIYYSTLFSIEGFVKRYGNLFKNPFLILTGGAGRFFVRDLNFFIYDRLLTLKGISLILERCLK